MRRLVQRMNDSKGFGKAGQYPAPQPTACCVFRKHLLEQRREARLDVFVISIGPPLLVENNEHIGKLRALEVRLVREVKVLNQFVTRLFATREVPVHEARGCARVREVKHLNHFSMKYA
jgi:hypothetical protein